MLWQEVCEHPGLKDLPFKIELDVDLSGYAFSYAQKFTQQQIVRYIYALY